MVSRQLQVERKTGKVRRPKSNVLPLCHATNQLSATNVTETQQLLNAAWQM